MDIMKNVDFLEKNEFHIKSRRLFGEPATPSMITFLLKTGIAKNEKQALVILTIFVLIIFILTAWLSYSNFRPSTDSRVTDQYGNVYTFEEYIELIRQNKDPLLQN